MKDFSKILFLLEKAYPLFMNKLTFIILLCLSLFMELKGFTEEVIEKEALPLKPVSEAPLNFLELNSENLDNYFKISTLAEFKNQNIKLLEELKNLLHEVTQESSKILKPLIEKIALNLKSYEQLLEAKTSQKATSPLILPAYSIEEALNIERTIRTLETELKNIQDDLVDSKAELASLQEAFIKQKRAYDSIKESSEAKLIAGIELFSEKLTLEFTRLKFINLNDRALDKEKTISLLEASLDNANANLISTQEESDSFFSKLEEIEKKWILSKELLRQAEAKETRILSESQNDAETSLLASIEEDRAEINEALLHNQALLASSEYYLSKVILSSQSLNLQEIRKIISSNKTKLNTIRKKSLEWQLLSERQIQRLGQLLSQEPLETSSSDGLNQKQRTILKTAQDNLLLIQKLNNEMEDTLFINTLLEKQVSLKSAASERWLQDILDFGKRIWKSFQDSFKKELFSIGKNPVTILNILQFIFIIFSTIWLSRIVLRALTNLAINRRGIKKSLVYRITRLINYLLLAIGMLFALSTLGFDFSNFLLVAGALGVGLGFGLQSIFNNFISGIIILFESHLKVGDYIELESGLKGEIREINVRNTVITDNDGIDVLIPNSEIISSKVLNWTMKSPYRRFHIPFKTAYGTDKELVQKVVVEAAKKVPHTLARIGIPEPQVRLLNLGENGLEFELVVWVSEQYTKRFGKASSDYLWAIETALNNEKIVIPIPKREIQIIHSDSSHPQDSNPSENNK